MTDPSGLRDTTERRLLSGWGRTAPTAAELVRPESPAQVPDLIAKPGPRGAIARGYGRSYGDSAQNAGGVVVDGTSLTGAIHLDTDAHTVRVAGGVSIEALLHHVVPHGYFVPVSPGTRHVTIGGCIASDVHGKNHHADGTFNAHVRSITLALGTGEVVECSPTDRPDLFWATAGGLGLTGVVLEATVALPAIETALVSVDTQRLPDLDAAMAAMAADDDRYRYSVAWIDLMARGRATGRSVLTRGDFAPHERAAGHARNYAPRTRMLAPAFVPNGLLNAFTVRLFNEGWYRRAPRHRTGELQSISAFFYPLDLVDGWNRLYGPAGFLQWQVVVPLGEEDTLRELVSALSQAGHPSFLAVLKRFGAANPGPLSFPLPGWTLAFDVPVPLGRHAPTELGDLLDQLDRRVADAGGRVYLAKDSRLRPELVAEMYPRLDEWRAAQAAADPDRRIQSDIARRLHLLG